MGLKEKAGSFKPDFSVLVKSVNEIKPVLAFNPPTLLLD